MERAAEVAARWACCRLVVAALLAVVTVKWTFVVAVELIRGPFVVVVVAAAVAGYSLASAAAAVA